MTITSIGSSSSGNSYIVKVGEANFILDIGLSARKILNAIENVGLDVSDIDAVFITHEHIDHIRSIKAIAKKCPDVKFYMSPGTYNSCDSARDIDEDRVEFVSAGDIVCIRDAKVRCFALSHDAAEPVGYSFIERDEQLSVVTDTGIVTEGIFSEIRTADYLVFESNHEENLLMMGEYPYHVKMRIKSDYGHLSNVACGESIARLLECRKSGGVLNIMLAHLSDKNNTPYQARITVEDILRQNGYERDKNYNLSIAAKEGLTRL